MNNSAKRFFAGQSARGSETSHGFANDWDVYVFESKAARDRFVSESRNLSCIAIKKADVTRHAANYSMTQNRAIAPQPFSGEYWGVTDSYLPDNADELGIVGTVMVCQPGDRYERLY